MKRFAFIRKAKISLGGFGQGKVRVILVIVRFRRAFTNTRPARGPAPVNIHRTKETCINTHTCLRCTYDTFLLIRHHVYNNSEIRIHNNSHAHIARVAEMLHCEQLMSNILRLKHHLSSIKMPAAVLFNYCEREMPQVTCQ